METVLFFLWHLGLIGFGIAFIGSARGDRNKEKEKRKNTQETDMKPSKDWGYFFTGLIFWAIGIGLIATALSEIIIYMLVRMNDTVTCQ